MSRPLSPATRVILLVSLAALATAACGSGASAAKASPSPSPDRGAQARNGAAGQLVQITGQTLILTGASGDITITYTTSTTFTRTSTGVLADIAPGACLVATGQKDATGALTASTVRVSPTTASGCGAGQFGPGAGAAGSPRPTPSGQPAQPALAFIAGEVKSAAGTTITVRTAASVDETITVPVTASITKTSPASSSNLRTGECLRANGQRDATGQVLATSITMSPAGPNGTCATGTGTGRGPGRPGATPAAGAPGG